VGTINGFVVNFDFMTNFPTGFLKIADT